MGLWTPHLDLPDRRSLSSRAPIFAYWQENPSSRDVAGPDRALRGAGRLCADSSRRTRQPRRPELHGRYIDVLRRPSSARGRHGARKLGDLGFGDEHRKVLGHHNISADNAY